MKTLERFDRIIERHISAREMTCASYTVSVDGEVVRKNALGLADIAGGFGSGSPTAREFEREVVAEFHARETPK